MTERHDTSGASMLADFIFSLPFYTFSPSRIRDVRFHQRNACKDCGTDAEVLQVHHRVPRRYHGSGREPNAVALCPECHTKWDALADTGIVFPGIPFSEVEMSCFRNPNVRNKIIAQFSGDCE